MSIQIGHHPHKAFSGCPCIPTFEVNIGKAVKAKLKKNEELTSAIALKILKQIKWESDVLSFLTQPIVAIALSTMVVIASFCMILVTAPLIAKIFAIFVGTLGGFMFGFSIENTLTGFLPQLTEAYKQQSEKATEYIAAIEVGPPNLVISLV